MAIKSNKLYVVDAETNALIPVVVASVSGTKVIEGNKLFVLDPETNARIPVIEIRGGGQPGEGGGVSEDEVKVMLADYLPKSSPDNQGAIEINYDAILLQSVDDNGATEILSNPEELRLNKFDHTTGNYAEFYLNGDGVNVDTHGEKFLYNHSEVATRSQTDRMLYKATDTTQGSVFLIVDHISIESDPEKASELGSFRIHSGSDNIEVFASDIDGDGTIVSIAPKGVSIEGTGYKYEFKKDGIYLNGAKITS